MHMRSSPCGVPPVVGVQALLAAHARGSRRAVFVIEAQLGLLLQVRAARGMCAGERQWAAQQPVAPVLLSGC